MRSLPDGPFARNALDLACAGRLQLAQAVSCRLFGILKALPLVLGFQPGPFVRVDRSEIGSLEFAIGRGLGCQQQRIGPANAQFGMLQRFDVSTDTRKRAGRSCLYLPLNRIWFRVRRIARTSPCSHRQDNDRDGQQFRGRQQAIGPKLRPGEFAAIICTMRGIRDRHADHPIQGESGCGRGLQRTLAEAGQLWTKNLNPGLTTRMNEALIGSVSPLPIRSARGRSGHWRRSDLACVRLNFHGGHQRPAL
jgi:hypothetical protein